MSGFYHLILFFYVAYEEWGVRVVFVSVFDDGFGAFVGVAVFAEVRAGAVGAYVISEQTGAAFSGLGALDVWDFQFEVEGFFQLFFCHAAACV